VNGRDSWPGKIEICHFHDVWIVLSRERLNIYIWSLMMKEHRSLFQNPKAGIFLPHRWWYHTQAKAMVMALASFLVLYVTNSPAPTMTFDVTPTRSRELDEKPWLCTWVLYIYIYIYSNGKQRRCTVTLFKQIYDCTHRPIFPRRTNMFERKFNQNVCGLILLVNYLVNFLMDLVYRYL